MNKFVWIAQGQAAARRRYVNCQHTLAILAENQCGDRRKSRE